MLPDNTNARNGYDAITCYKMVFLVGPAAVTITKDHWPLSSYRQYIIKCSTYGSIPPATISWWKEGNLLGLDQQTVRYQKRILRN